MAESSAVTAKVLATVSKPNSGVLEVLEGFWLHAAQKQNDMITNFRNFI